MHETKVRSLAPWLGSGRSTGGGNGNHSSILAWVIPQTEGPGELQSTGLQRVEHVLVTKPTKMTKCVPSLEILFKKILVLNLYTQPC